MLTRLKFEISYRRCLAKLTWTKENTTIENRKIRVKIILMYSKRVLVISTHLSKFTIHCSNEIAGC